MDYNLTEEAESRLRRRIMLQAIPLALVAGTVGVGITLASANSGQALWLAVPLISVALALGLAKSYRRELRRLRSFVLRVTPDSIVREMEGMPPRQVQRGEITRITRSSDGTVSIHGEGNRKLMVVPSTVSNPQALLDELTAFRSIEPEEPTKNRWWLRFAPWLSIGAFAVVAVSRNRALVIVIGTVLFLALMTCLVLLWRNKELETRLRRMSLLGLLPALAILARVVAALTGSLN
jgi:hypothetical protein